MTQIGSGRKAEVKARVQRAGGRMAEGNSRRDGVSVGRYFTTPGEDPMERTLIFGVG